MQKYTLKYRDDHGRENRLEVDRDRFTVGRHSACDLTVVDGRLSREHAQFELGQRSVTVTDLGSSNGTTVNGIPIDRPFTLTDGDVINLGGGLEMTFEAGPVSSAAPAGSAVEPEPAPLSFAGEPVAESPAAAAAAVPDGSFAADGIPTSFFIIAPLLGVVVLAVVVGAIMLFGGPSRGGNDVVRKDDEEQKVETGDDESDRRSPKPRGSDTPYSTDPGHNSLPAGSSPSPGDGGSSSPVPIDDSEISKVEAGGARFLKQIAPADASPFLTREQAEKVKPRVRQLIGSSSLKANLNSARRGAQRIGAKAKEQGLNPNLLAVAAITKLGSSSGDVAQTADEIADEYKKLQIHIGSNLADYVLLMVAAYGQGDPMKIPTIVEKITGTKGSPDEREVRTIWYLEKAGKLTPAEFDRALTFLAVGIIAQNPAAFGVNAEALKL